MKKLTPVRAIRQNCKDCMDGQNEEVRICPSEDCVCWGYRMGHRPKSCAKLTPIRTIRAKCMDCTGQQISETRNCSFEKCPLWGYRMGHRPKMKVVS